MQQLLLTDILVHTITTNIPWQKKVNVKCNFDQILAFVFMAFFSTWLNNIPYIRCGDGVQQCLMKMFGLQGFARIFCKYRYLVTVLKNHLSPSKYSCHVLVTMLKILFHVLVTKSKILCPVVWEMELCWMNNNCLIFLES